MIPYNPSADAEVDLVIFYQKVLALCHEVERGRGTSGPWALCNLIVAGLNLCPLIIMRSRRLDVLVLLYLLDVNTLSGEPL